MATAKKKKTNTRLTKELPETARDMHASGIMDDAAYEKITMRHLGRAAETRLSRQVHKPSVQMEVLAGPQT